MSHMLRLSNYPPNTSPYFQKKIHRNFYSDDQLRHLLNNPAGRCSLISYITTTKPLGETKHLIKRTPSVSLTK